MRIQAPHQRVKGTIPVTVAIKNGDCCIGLTLEDLHDLAKAGRSAIILLARRLLQVVLVVAVSIGMHHISIWH